MTISKSTNPSVSAGYGMWQAVLVGLLIWGAVAVTPVAHATDSAPGGGSNVGNGSRGSAKESSSCELLKTSRDSTEILEDCAFELTSLADLTASVVTAQGIFAPIKPPKELFEKITHFYGVKHDAGPKKLQNARHYMNARFPSDVQKTARYWLNELIISQSPCSVPANYEIGRHAVDPNPSPVISSIEAEASLAIAALEKYPPAMLDCGRLLLKRHRNDDDVSRGYGFILAAMEMSDGDHQILSSLGIALTHKQLQNAQMQRDIILRRSASISYLGC